MALSLVANYLSTEERHQATYMLTFAAIALAAFAALFTLHVLSKPRRRQRALVVSVRLPDWSSRWQDKAKDYVRGSLAGGRAYEYKVTESDLAKSSLTKKIIDDILSEERREIDETARPHVPTALFLSLPTPLAFQLGARLRNVSNVLVLQERIKTTRSQAPFYEAINFQSPRELRRRHTPVALISEIHLDADRNHSDIALIVNITKNSFKAAALHHAHRLACTASIVLDIAEPTRSIPEHEDAMTYILHWSCSTIGRFIDEVTTRTLTTSSTLPTFHLYIKCPVSLAFGLGVSLSQRAEFKLYYISNGSVIGIPAVSKHASLKSGEATSSSIHELLVKRT